jgi:hypothetical protein
LHWQFLRQPDIFRERVDHDLAFVELKIAWSFLHASFEQVRGVRVASVEIQRSGIGLPFWLSFQPGGMTSAASTHDQANLHR